MAALVLCERPCDFRRLLYDRKSTQRLPCPIATRRTAGRAPVRRSGSAPRYPLARTCARLIEPPFDCQPVETSHDTEIKCALVDGATRYLVLASWRALLNRMLAFAMSSGDSIEADIRQLHALCEQQDQEALLPLKPHELAPEIPRRMLQFNRLVDDAVELARERDIVNTDRLNVAPRRSRIWAVPALGQQGSRCLGGRVVRGRSHALGQEPGNAPLDHLPLLGRRHYCR